MLKRNLIAIAIMMLGMGLAGTAYGQLMPTTMGAKSKTTVKPSGTATNGWFDGSFDIAGRDSFVQTKRIDASAKSRGATRPQAFSITEIEMDGAKKPKSAKERSKTENRTRDMQNQRIRKPVKPNSYNLGDTATHEVGH